MRRALAGSAALTLIWSTAFAGLALAQDPSAAPTEGEPPHPAHIHSGTCANLGGIVEPLRDITFPDRAGTPDGADASPAAGADASPAVGASPSLTQAPEALGPTGTFDTSAAQVSITRVDMTIAEMRRGNHAINAHESATSLARYIACGDIVGGRGDRNVVIPLLEQTRSGYRGVAFLHEDGNRTTVFVTLFNQGDGVTVEPGPDASIAPASIAPASIAPASFAPSASEIPVPIASPATPASPAASPAA